MPKLVVFVEKDETGKLWNYVFPEKEWSQHRNQLNTMPLRIHTTKPPEETTPTPTPEKTEKETITFHVIPPEETTIKNPKKTKVKE